MSSNMASRLWTRARSLGRDTFTISSAFAREFRNSRQFGDAWRNVLVSQARQSNQLANSVLSFQQQINLMRYHGFMNYWKNHRPAILNIAGPTPSASFSTTTEDSDKINKNNNNDNGNVAQVAFMITAAMRKEMTENLGYTADQIKALTPIEASLILHHKLPPAEKDEKLPGLVQAHQAEQERIQKEQAELERQKQEKLEQERLERENMEKEKALSAEQQTSVQSEDAAKESASSETKESPKISARGDPVEGINVDSSQGPGLSSQKGGQDPETMTGGPLGSFVASMEEKVDTTQEWYQVLENGQDGSSVPVALFNTEDEASEVLKLKEEFASRRARSDPHNLENEPTTTYTIQKIVM